MAKKHWSDGLILWVHESPTSYRAVIDGGIMATIRQSDDKRYRLSGAWGAEGVFDSLGDAMSALQEAFSIRGGNKQ